MLPWATLDPAGSGGGHRVPTDTPLCSRESPWSIGCVQAGLGNTGRASGDSRLRCWSRSRSSIGVLYSRSAVGKVVPIPDGSFWRLTVAHFVEVP